MKKLKIIMIVLMLIETFGVLNMAAEKNYQDALFYARQSEGTDSAIEQAMSEHGFNVAWHETPNQLDKIKALFN